MPTSEADLEARVAAAWPCVVFLMRSRGGRLPAAEVMRREPSAGALLCEQRGDTWQATLYGPGMEATDLLLVNAQLLRDRNECRLYRGLERDERRPRWQQTWLCTPSIERGLEILREMQFQQFGGGM